MGEQHHQIKYMKIVLYTHECLHINSNTGVCGITLGVACMQCRFLHGTCWLYYQ